MQTRRVLSLLIVSLLLLAFSALQSQAAPVEPTSATTILIQKNLADAIKSGDVTMRVKGDGHTTSSIHAIFTNETGEQQTFVINAYTCLIPDKPGYQIMVITAEQIVSMLPNETLCRKVPTVCGDNLTKKPPPESGVAYSPGEYPSPGVFTSIVSIVETAEKLEGSGTYEKQNVPIPESRRRQTIEQLCVWKTIGETTPETTDDVTREWLKNRFFGPSTVSYESLNPEQKKKADTNLDKIFFAVDLTLKQSSQQKPQASTGNTFYTTSGDPPLLQDGGTGGAPTGGKKGGVKTTAKKPVGPSSTWTPFQDPETKFWGFKDKFGTVAIPAKYKKKPGLFIQGLAIVTVDGKKQYIDASGKPQFKGRKFDEASSFDNGVAVVRVGTSYFLIDHEGKAISSQYAFIGKSTKDGLYSVKVFVKDGSTSVPRWGFINRQGTVVVDPTKSSFVDTRPFSNGVARVETKDGWGLIDKDGKFVVKPQYDRIQTFYDGIAVVKKDGKFGYITVDGKEIVKPIYDQARPFFFDRAVVKSGDKYGFVGNDGKVVVEPQYDYAGDFADKKGGPLAVVEKDGKRIYIAPDGTKVVDLSDFSKSSD